MIVPAHATKRYPVKDRGSVADMSANRAMSEGPTASAAPVQGEPLLTALKMDRSPPPPPRAFHTPGDLAPKA